MSRINRRPKLVIILFLCLISILFSISAGALLISYSPKLSDAMVERSNGQFSLQSINDQAENIHGPTTSLPSRARQELVIFENVTAKVGLAGVSGNFFSWGDYNNDEYQDLLVNGGRLFKNNGPPNYSFTEVTGDAGLSGGGNGAWADYDNDGYLDLYCTGNHILWHNDGPPNYNFKDVTIEAGNIRNDYPTTAVGWGDYDLDGYVDLYIANGEDWNDGDPIYYPDSLYHNNGNGTFTDVTTVSGIRNFGGPYYGRGVAWGDFDNNGWPDIYISNYRISENWLFYNNRNGTFTNVAHEYGVAGEESERLGTTYYGHTVGSAWADLDNDGDLDLFESNLVHKDIYRGPICGDSQIYRNDGLETNYGFTDVREGSGVPEKNIGGGEDELYVGIAMGDFDNDGFLDFFIPQIYDLEYSYSYLYHNNGDWTFSNVSAQVGVLVWNTYGGSWCDYNNDGFLDLITGGRGSSDLNESSELHLYENGRNTNSWLHIKLQGKHYNKQGIGVRVKVTATTLAFSQIRELEGGMGCHSQQNSIPVEFGFGSYSGTVNVEVFWPSGFVQKIEDVFLNQFLKIEEPNQAPDMLFINAKSLAEFPIQGDVITLEASVANMGYLDAKRAVVKFYDDVPSEGTMIAEKEITDLAKFHSITVTTPWDTTGYAGEFDIWAVIDDVDPKELVISNNVFNFTLVIREENEEPEAVLSAFPLKDLLPGATVTFDASNSTDDIKIEYYNFDFGDGNSTDWIINSKVEHQYQTPGKFNAKLKVKDSDDAVSTNLADALITITALPTPNRPPVIESFTADPTELSPSEVTTLRVQAQDPDNDELTYHITASAGELSTKEYKSTATWTAPDKEGIFTITAKVSDGEFFSTEESVDVRVEKEQKNEFPIITDIIVDPSQIYPGNSSTIIVQAYDPNPSDILTYSYEANFGQILGSGSQVTWLAPDAPGVYTVVIKVTDPAGLYISEEITIIVLNFNYPSKIKQGHVNPAVVGNDVSTPIFITVEVTDQNGLGDIYKVTVDLSTIGGDSNQKLFDNGKFGDVRGDDGVFSYEYIVPEALPAGTKVLEVTVQDNALNSIKYDLRLDIRETDGDGESAGSGLPGFQLIIIIICLVCVMIYLSTPKHRKI